MVAWLQILRKHIGLGRACWLACSPTTASNASLCIRELKSNLFPSICLIHSISSRYSFKLNGFEDAIAHYLCATSVKLWPWECHSICAPWQTCAPLTRVYCNSFRIRKWPRISGSLCRVAIYVCPGPQCQEYIIPLPKAIGAISYL